MTPTEVLLELDLTPEQTLQLSGRVRTRLVSFLLRWKHHVVLAGYLDDLIPANPDLVSLLDARARMLVDQGLPNAALDTMRERHQLRTSMSSRALVARIHLARGDVHAALDTARTLVAEAGDKATPWSLLGEVHLTEGDHVAASAACRRLNEIRPDSRAYLLGMMAVHRVQGDWVTASGYAVRLQQTASSDTRLPVAYLRLLRAYFEASGETNRAADIATELGTRHTAELADLEEALAVELGPRLPRRVEPEPDEVAQPLTAPAKALDSFETVSVSPQERTGLVAAAGRIFGYKDLLPGQAAIMACTMRGEDVLAVLPTGGGKSLCYQLPALLAKSGTTLVVSPLIALMKDQVDKLPSDVSRLATTINSTLGGDELHRRLRKVRAGGYRLVYAAPERLRQPLFLHGLRSANVNRLVIDEVHCVSMWGHDFRPDYLYIAEARQALGNPPLLAMTATAPPRVRRDILRRLGEMRVIAGDVLRPNLRLEVFLARNNDEKLRYLLTFCNCEQGGGIVYAGTRARCEELAGLLHSRGISAIHYHAGIPNRAAVQDEFMSGRVRVIVATVAFGMGIDKSDIRFIVHFVPPPSLESYYQEAGRAGRDGLPARCVLMYAPSDRATLTRRARRDALAEDFLRQVYASVKQHLRGASIGRVAIDDLRRDVQAERTPVRVAISVLEQVGLVRRGQDAPRRTTVRLTRALPKDDPELAAFCQAARLRHGQPLGLDLLEVGREAGLDVENLERRLLGWVDAGWLECQSSGRDPLLEVLPPPADARERLGVLLEQYEKVQGQRVDEIVAYAKTRRCRHGHISAYLGGRAVDQCTACDNCLDLEPLPSGDSLPDEVEQLQTVLRCLTESHGWGQLSLVRILRGSPEAPESSHQRPAFGALAFRSKAAIQRMLKRLMEAKLLGARRLHHGGVVLESTPAGRQALRDPAALRALAGKRAGKAAAQRRTVPSAEAKSEDASAGAPPVADDDELFQRLRAWRREKARAAEVPAFVIAHDSVLRRIAAQCPRAEGELLAVKGIGPHKLEKYGAELLALVRGTGEE
ncbi:MAG TPA: RecQ family ATP-dependent DNA helicase [Anaerolineae bacterium]|nr:RecQ family ATP-dependent DNA helicase [Anaerolineae bacterium]